VYNLLADKELRKKLNDAGLPTHGHRKVFVIHCFLAVDVVNWTELCTVAAADDCCAMLLTVTHKKLFV